MMPASNMKIITSAAALTLLGPEYTYKTTFLTDGEVRDSLLDGDLLDTLETDEDGWVEYEYEADADVGTHTLRFEFDTDTRER